MSDDARVEREELKPLFERYPETVALLSWAAWAVDSLAYLVILDERSHGPSKDNMVFHPDTLDMAHCRWSLTTAITAVDLCAAALQQMHEPRELDAPLPDDNPQAWSLRSLKDTKQNKNRRAKVPAPELAWADGVQVDPDYLLLQPARNPFVHSRHIRLLMASTSSPKAHELRTRFQFGSSDKMMDARDVVLTAQAAADRWTQELFRVLVDQYS